MILRARQAGLSRDQFWDMTMREVVQEFVVVKRWDESRHQEVIARAWWTATLSRAKKVPPLAELLKKRGKQTAEEQAEVWRQAARVFGLKVSRHNRKAARIVRPGRG